MPKYYLVNMHGGVVSKEYYCSYCNKLGNHSFTRGDDSYSVIFKEDILSIHKIAKPQDKICQILPDNLDQIAIHQLNECPPSKTYGYIFGNGTNSITILFKHIIKDPRLIEATINDYKKIIL
jgi:hypothetical protein